MLAADPVAGETQDAYWADEFFGEEHIIGTFQHLLHEQDSRGPLSPVRRRTRGPGRAGLQPVRPHALRQQLRVRVSVRKHEPASAAGATAVLPSAARAI